MNTNTTYTARNTRNTSTRTNSTNTDSRSTYPSSLIISDLDVRIITEGNLVCLRNKKTGRVENVSYSEQGLTFTFDKIGLPLYYKYPNTVYTSSGYFTAQFKGTMEKNPNMLAEQFIPKNHVDETGRMNYGAQSSEVFFVAKALRLLSPMNGPGETITEIKARMTADAALEPNS
jgi:hypothetical protein